VLLFGAFHEKAKSELHLKNRPTAPRSSMRVLKADNARIEELVVTNNKNIAQNKSFFMKMIRMLL